MLPLFGEVFGNPSSVHSEGRAARVRLDEAREQVAALIGARPDEIIFTSGGTEANNFAILGAALSGKGRHIITSAVEHLSVLNPCRQLQGQGFEVDLLPVDGLGRVDPAEVEKHITASTALITIQHANSEVGTLQDVQSIAILARQRGILFHCDAVQSVGKIAVDTGDLPADMLSISSHKLYGPKGVGALYLKRGTPPLFSPVSGGSQERKRRGGTENVPGIVGFGKACERAAQRLGSGEWRRIARMRDRLCESIKERFPDARFFGDLQSRLPNTLGVGFANLSGETLLIGLDVEGISVSTGSACSSGSALPSQVLTAMQVPENLINGSLRFSLGISNTEPDMDRVVETLFRIISRNR